MILCSTIECHTGAILAQSALAFDSDAPLQGFAPPQTPMQDCRLSTIGGNLRAKSRQKQSFAECRKAKASCLKRDEPLNGVARLQSDIVQAELAQTSNGCQLDQLLCLQLEIEEVQSLHLHHRKGQFLILKTF